jgi:hypothetical protein
MILVVVGWAAALGARLGAMAKALPDASEPATR